MWENAKQVVPFFWYGVYEIGSGIRYITLHRTRQVKGKFIRLAIVNVQPVLASVTFE